MDRTCLFNRSIGLAYPAQAQDYPNRAIKFVVPFPAGGPADTISRILTEKMASLIGQSMVIENRAGAGGLTGIASVAKARTRWLHHCHRRHRAAWR